MKNELATIILAAGKGTRMNSELPKVLHEVGQKPMLSHVIETSKIIGSKRIVSVIGYKHEMVKSVKKSCVEIQGNFEFSGFSPHKGKLK